MASMVALMAGMVVVRSAEQHTMSVSSCSCRKLTNCSGATSTPRSATSKPLDSIIMRTRFLPMSCMSPFTVPMTALPSGSAPASARWGFSTSVPAAMARAATSISGTNTSPALNLSPITPMAGTSAPFRMASGSTPSASACSTSGATSFFFPRCTALEMSSRIPMSFSFPSWLVDYWLPLVVGCQRRSPVAGRPPTWPQAASRRLRSPVGRRLPAANRRLAGPPTGSCRFRAPFPSSWAGPHARRPPP